jgi:glyoxylate/hydroxypyruvate reductase A
VSGPIEGVYVSRRLPLDKIFGAAFAPYADRLRLRRPEEIEDASSVRFALAWLPAEEAFAPYPNLVHVSSIAAGVDSLIHCPSLPAQAVLTRVRDDEQADLMAGFCVWHVIWHHRNMQHTISSWQQGTWDHLWHSADQAPRHCPVGILGYGLMGERIARAVAALGFPVLAASRNAKDRRHPGISVLHGPGAIDAVARRARILINVLPLTDETRNILNTRLFTLMPKGAVLLQFGRGEHLVDADLDTALAAGHLSAASLDVFRSEPLPADHRWWKDRRILITPHQASDTAAETVAEQAVAALADILAGRLPATAIDRSVGY